MISLNRKEKENNNNSRHIFRSLGPEGCKAKVQVALFHYKQTIRFESGDSFGIIVLEIISQSKKYVCLLKKKNNKRICMSSFINNKWNNYQSIEMFGN